MKTILTALFIGLFLAFSSCTEAQKDNPNETEQQETSQARIIDVSVEQFRELVNKRDDILLDVRTPNETARGHIEGASFIDFYDPGFEQKINLMQKDKPIYIYCRSGARSSKAAEIMIKNGFGVIYNLNGGIGAWIDAGYMVVKPKGQSDENIQELTLDDFNKLLDTEQPILVDFHTQWCAPCKKMAPIVDKLQKEFEGKATILRVDADKSKALARHYNVKGVPVFIVFKSGNEIWRNTGLMKENTLREVITDAIDN